jgi:hypothetical protein
MADGFIYLIGGTDFYYTKNTAIEKYEVERNIWKLLSVKLKVSTKITLCHAISNEKILIFGGFEGENKTIEVIQYDVNKRR